MDFVEDQMSLAVNGMDPPLNLRHVVRALDLNHPTLACDLDDLNRPEVIVFRIATTAGHTSLFLSPYHCMDDTRSLNFAKSPASGHVAQVRATSRYPASSTYRLPLQF